MNGKKITYSKFIDQIVIYFVASVTRPTRLAAAGVTVAVNAIKEVKKRRSRRQVKKAF